MSGMTKKRRELKKHVNAIHCTNNLTLVQRKLFNALLFQAYSKLPHQSRFEIRARDLCVLIGYNSNDYKKLKNALLGLVSIAIEWNVINCATGEETKWRASSILASAELSGGWCVYEYSTIMKELLFQPEIYGRIDMELMPKFKSNYGLALYENCVRYQGLPQTPWFSLDVFRRLMGVSDGKYKEFRELKKRVIKKAVDEVNAVSSLNLSVEFERKNKSISCIRFLLSKNKISTDSQQRDVLPDELSNILQKVFSLSEKSCIEMMERYGANYIQEKVDIILSSESYASGKIKGLAGYLVSALTKDFKQNKSSNTVIIDAKMKKQKEKEEEEGSKKDLRARYEKIVRNKIEGFLSKLSHVEHEAIIAEFEEQTIKNDSFLAGRYKKHKFSHPAVNACFFDYIKTSRADKVGFIPTFDDYISFVDVI